MAASQPSPRPARPGREGAWEFVRTLLGLWLLAWLLAALFSPPHPLPFLVATALLWVLATVAAWWLVAGDGFARLRASPHYAPGLPAGRTLVLFLAVALAVKLGGTLLVDELVRAQPGYVVVPPRQAVPVGKTAVRDRPYGYDLLVSLVAVGSGYVLVVRGVLGSLDGQAEGDAGSGD